ncbi:NADP-dependent oxidoreductase [Rhodococcus sp. IEGM 1330]|uniref:NADP-dependent oxidoreductase n=1 Tax=Rhodococcus sp. IEGM 1330 TaxID=3082225 RepID=UPI002952F339|nr:NADP-dependent oxidoreductase [Rhodococcus sp. IEGM 1330]MDV8023580.1 NADP-dependent oxidoreductase [Rhodococcus sp. IEGM 1330]
MIDTMRAVAIDEHGSASVLKTRTLARPTPNPGEVLVRIRVAGVQLTDAAIRGGWVPPGATIEFPQILGNEFSGIVEALGADVHQFAVGDDVLGYRVLGCYAEYVSVPANQIVAKPPSVSWRTAGALSASGQTAHTALERLGARAGETLLVHGAAGGVGSMAVQLALHQGLRVIGTASRDNHPYLEQMGAVAVTYGSGQAERIMAAAPEGVDVVFDAAGHENLRTAVALTYDRSRIGTIVDIALARELNCQWISSDRSAERLRDLVDLCATGQLRVTVRAAYVLDETGEAHRDVETGHGRGKVVLLVDEGS